MCGIGLIVSGLELPSRLLHHRTRTQTQTEADTHTQKQSETDGAEDKEEAFDEGQIHQVVAVSAENLIEVLERRGPNFIRKHTVFLNSKELDYDDAAMGKKQSVHLPLTQLDKKISQLKLEFVAATLQLRGASVTLQPLMDECNNVLVYNGEIFGGLPVKTNENDSQCLFESLCRCCFCVCHMKSPKTETCICIRSEEFGMTHVSVPEILSSIKGPWALIFWQAKSRTLWFGRDAFGRRSLLVHWPSRADQRLVFSSVSPTSNMPSARNDVMFEYWEELHCGIYSCSIQASAKDCYEAPNYGFEGRLEEHPWEDKGLARMVAWERSHVLPPPEFTHDRNSSESRRYMLRVLSALRESVRRRTSNIFKYDEGQMTCLDTSSSNAQTSMVAPVAVLFSGGLDSMILSSILDQCLPPPWSIDLLNVSFGGPSAPDRISAIAGVKELSKVSPSRSWRLVEVDGDLSSLGELQDHLLSLICPSRTYMDLNIGTALWLAAEGRGWVKDSTSVTHYTSDARVILVGSGADEQCAGYGRHRTKFREGGWETLDREMKLDVQRLWKRNMGRDDRCIGDHGKEARFPFLDEDVIQSLLDIPLWYIADLREPSGQGDKKILREIAVMLGLTSCASLPKRAIQFGTRIAQESNRKIFGSNRAANQASAGSAPLHCFEGHVKVDDV